jgi:hypothetical protein
MYSTQHYVIRFVSDFRQVGGFLRVLQFLSTNKTYQNIVESESGAKLMENQKWTMQRNWQHRIHKTQCEDKPNKKHNTICVGHHHKQTMVWFGLWSLAPLSLSTIFW